MKKTLLSTLLLGCVLTSSAQPRCNDDGTVTFQYKNDSARTVMVDVQFAGRKEMTRNADGLLVLPLPICIPIVLSWMESA